jgi:hypothetical protein
MSRRGDERKPTQGDLMARYAVQPLGRGSYGLYDKSAQKFIHTYSGRGAERKADRKWREMVGVS